MHVRAGGFPLAGGEGNPGASLTLRAAAQRGPRECPARACGSWNLLCKEPVAVAACAPFCAEPAAGPSCVHLELQELGERFPSRPSGARVGEHRTQSLTAARGGANFVEESRAPRALPFEHLRQESGWRDTCHLTGCSPCGPFQSCAREGGPGLAVPTACSGGWPSCCALLRGPGIVRLSERIGSISAIEPFSRRPPPRHSVLSPPPLGPPFSAGGGAGGGNFTIGTVAISGR